jgi:dUTPase
MIVAPVTQAVWQEVTSISATQRNDGGFGHTGK